jgi:two-component system, LytTR family, sensor kinase
VKLFSILTRFRWLILGAAILKWMSLHVWIVNSWFGMDLQLALWDSILSNILLVGVSLALINVLMHYVAGFGKFWFALGLSFAFSWAWLWLTNESITGLAVDNERYLHFIMMAYPVRWCIGFLVIAGVSICSIFYNQLNEQVETSKREADTKNLAREAELQKLQLQLQPHFLFNSLNSINAMIQLRPTEARTMVEQLSDFLRITTKRADQHWIKFEEEWQYVNLYLAIERVRFGHRLSIEHAISDEIEECTIPTMLFQPLIENAIKFGLYGTTDKISITIDVYLEDNSLIIRITNPFDAEMQPKQGSGFGLSGLRRRLYLLYARNDLLSTSIIDNIFTVSLKIPLSNA